MKIDALTPNAAVLEELDARLERVRKQRGLSQEALAEEAGVGVATLRRIESGSDGRLGSWVRLLRALGMSASLDQLLPETFRSPLSEARAQRRARGGSGDAGFVWGDEKR
ncbi:MAG: helix-turn-helix transcriptional regulator [Planctomycetes bacterium]|nr:helix-turn-helix transcriptional regulator [Planctomycetota bacterium]